MRARSHPEVASTREALAQLGRPLPGTRVAVQGFGNVGSVSATLLATAGARIVAVTDSRGGARNPRGLDPQALLAHKRAAGTLADRIELIDRFTRAPVPQDKHSLTFAIEYRDPSKTLTAAEADAAHQRIVSALKDRFGAALR